MEDQIVKRRLWMWCSSLLFLALACQTISGNFVPALHPSVPVNIDHPGAFSLPPFHQEPAKAVPLNPQPAPIDCPDDRCLNQCLDRLDNILQLNSDTFADPAQNVSQAGLDLVVYPVQGNRLLNPQFLDVPAAYKTYQEDTAKQRLLWSYTAWLLPPDQLGWIKQYLVFTDGSGNRLARVIAMNPDRGGWTLGIDPADTPDAWYLTQSLVHELGHLITLNSDQILPTDQDSTWDQNPAACEQFLSPDGCSKPSSYINLYYGKFWKDLLEDWIQSVGAPVSQPEGESGPLVNAFYIRHSEDFSREYAATNIFEDMADSFAMFVLNPKPTHDSVVFDKMRFYYDFPELVDLRTHIIQNICTYTKPSP